MFDVIGGDIQKRSAGLIRAGGTLVTVVGPAEARPDDGLAVDFVVESDRAQLAEIGTDRQLSTTTAISLLGIVNPARTRAEDSIRGDAG